MASTSDVVGLCNTQQAACGKLTIASQCIDYLRFGPLSPDFTWSMVEQRFDYLDITKVNYYGKWFVDLSGSSLEIIRQVEGVQPALEWLWPIHWSRLDIAFDVYGLDITKVIQPGTVIMNGGRVETIYSHHLKKRGNHDIFIRIYDAWASGHDCSPGMVRLEVEFKGSQPDAIKALDSTQVTMFRFAAQHITRKFAIALPVDMGQEINPPKRPIAFASENFYTRYGRRILNDIADMGMQQFYDYVRECRRTDDAGS